MQNLSPDKLAHLYEAKHHFELALNALEAIRPHKGTASRSQGNGSGTPSTPEPKSCPQTPGRSPEGKFKPCFGAKVDELNHFLAAASRCNQESAESELQLNEANNDQLLNISPAQWLAGSNEPYTTPLCYLTKAKTPSPTVRLGFPVVVSTIRCDRLAGELVEFVNGHIEWIDAMIDEVVKAREQRVDASTLNDEMNEKEKVKAKRDLIEKRRTVGWVRERFDARKTQALCKLALEEL